SQPAIPVAGKSRKDMAPGAGDKVEVTAKYSDGQKFGPTTLTWAEGKPQVVTIPTHTPPEPTKIFTYQVRNDGDEPVDVEVVITKDGKPKTLPLMKADKKKTIDLLEMEGQSLTITGIYGDGKRAAPGTYQIATAPSGIYVIPQKG